MNVKGVTEAEVDSPEEAFCGLPCVLHDSHRDTIPVQMALFVFCLTDKSRPVSSERPQRSAFRHSICGRIIFEAKWLQSNEWEMAQISDLLRVFEGAINRGLIMATHDTGPKEINKKKQSAETVSLWQTVWANVLKWWRPTLDGHARRTSATHFELLVEITCNLTRKQKPYKNNNFSLSLN